MTTATTANGHIPVDIGDPTLYDVQTNAAGPAGSLPLDDDFLRHAPSGDIFGLSPGIAYYKSADFSLGYMAFFYLGFNYFKFKSEPPEQFLPGPGF